MAFQQMMDDFDENEEFESYDLSKDRSWELANKIIASESNADEIEKYRRQYSDLRKALEKELLGVLDQLESASAEDKAEIDAFIDGLLDRLKSHKMFKLMENKTVVGVGGRFSSGKSSLLNALFMGNSDLRLPEAQDASTSVPTFIINSASEQNQAHLCNRYGVQLNIDEKELAAISHGFKNRFGLGLSSFISYIDVTSKLVPKNVVVLDTPGYSKSNNDQVAALSDFTKAYKQLRSVDYLIWAFDITNGTITDEDFKFIKELAPRKQILIVACKSDLKEPSEIATVINQARNDATRRLSEFGCSLFDVVSFSARKADEEGTKRINEFLKLAQEDISSRESLSNQLNAKLDFIQKRLELVKSERNAKLNDLSKTLSQVTNVFSLEHLIKACRDSNVKLYGIEQRFKTNASKTSITCLNQLIGA